MSTLAASSQRMANTSGKVLICVHRGLRRTMAVPSPGTPGAAGRRRFQSSMRSVSGGGGGGGVVIPATNQSLSEMRQLVAERKNEHHQHHHHEPVASFCSAAVASSTPTSSALLDADEELSSHEEDDDDTVSTNDIDVVREAGMNRAELQALANQRPTPLRLADMYKYGTGIDPEQRLRNAQFLHRELPIRIAQRTIDLLTLPHGLSDAAPIRTVVSIYLNYLLQLRASPVPTTVQEEHAFTDMLQSFVLDRTSIPTSVAHGVAVWSEGGGGCGEGMERLHAMEDALYSFFTARVGLRFLIEHHVLSCRRESAKALRHVTDMFPPNNDDDKVSLGCIQTDCDVVKEAVRVSELVRQQTVEHYGVCPEINVVNCLDEQDDDGAPQSFTYVPHHLHYMLGELIKNSCRATVQRCFAQREEDKLNGQVGSKHIPLPPIRVVIVKGEEDVTIKIADKGGGIPRSRMAKIWKFAHSTADAAAECKTDFGTDAISGARIRGFGLPLARIYARYFGGELTLKSMEGYGLDAYLHLPRLGEAGENLPLRVRSSPGERDSTPTRGVRNFSTLIQREALPAIAIGRDDTTTSTTTTTTKRPVSVRTSSSEDYEATWTAAFPALPPHWRDEYGDGERRKIGMLNMVQGRAI